MNWLTFLIYDGLFFAVLFVCLLALSWREAVRPSGWSRVGFAAGMWVGLILLFGVPQILFLLGVISEESFWIASAAILALALLALRPSKNGRLRMP